MAFFTAFSSMLSFHNIFPFNSSQLLKHHFSFVSFRFYPVSLVPFFGTIDPCYRLGGQSSSLLLVLDAIHAGFGYYGWFISFRLPSDPIQDHHRKKWFIVRGSFWWRSAIYRHCIWMFDPLAAPIDSTRNRCASNLRPGISVSRVLCRWILATSIVCLFEKSACSAIHALGVGKIVHMISFIASEQDVTVLRRSAICFWDSLQTDGSSLSG